MCLRILSLETPKTLQPLDLLSQPGLVHCVYVDAKGDTKKESAEEEGATTPFDDSFSQSEKVVAF